VNSSQYTPDIEDEVGLNDRENQEKCGRVVALNQKAAVVLTSDQQSWRIVYQFLFPAINSDDNQDLNGN
jgi:hypothetical protein